MSDPIAAWLADAGIDAVEGLPPVLAKLSGASMGTSLLAGLYFNDIQVQSAALRSIKGEIIQRLRSRMPSLDGVLWEE